MRPIRSEFMGRLAALVTAFSVAAPAPLALAAAINADLGFPGDRTHSGSDGALSTGGTIWNGVVYNVSVAGLVDEMGAPTAVGLTYLSSPSPSPFMDFAALNDLQDTGMSGGGFELSQLDPNARYSLVVYATMNATFNLLHGGGNTGGGCISAPATYVLPGSMGQDYCRFDDLIPLELAPGVYGVRLSGLTGAITGFQLLGTAEDPGPVDTTPPDCTSAWLDADPAALEIRVSDDESGLASVEILLSENAVVDIAAFLPGTTDPVVLTMTAVDPALLARVSVASSDVGANAANCEFEIPASPPSNQGCPTPEACCAEMMNFYRSASTETGSRSLGRGRSGEAHRRVMERALERACSYIQAGANEEACNTLRQALRRTDGRGLPPDFVAGSAAVELAGRINALCEMLGCSGGTSASSGRLRPLGEDRFSEPATWGMIKSLYGSQE